MRARRIRKDASSSRSEAIEKKIVRRDGKHCVTSEDGTRSFGCYATRDAAERRLRQIEGFKTTKNMTDTDDDTNDSARENSPLLPAVLTFEAVAKGEMPDAGSGLPASLEQDIPPRFRFWKSDDADTARAIRDALVESSIVTESSLREIETDDGIELRRVEEVVKLAVIKYPDDAEIEIPVELTALEKAATLLVDSDEKTVVIDEKIVETFGAESVAERVAKLDTDWLVELKTEAIDLFKSLGNVVALRTRPGVVFASSADFHADPIVEDLRATGTANVVKKALDADRAIPIIKADEEQRIVFGIVLEPDTVDAQKDTINAVEIEKACHLFMEEHGTLGLQHKEAINGKVKLLENYIAPANFKVGTEKVKKGTWLMVWRVLDDELWAAVKAGEITGFSIGGHGVRKPAK